MQRVCPRIALGADRRTVADEPHFDHHCLAADPPARLSRSEQKRLCLTDRYPGCPVYSSSVGSGTQSAAGHPLLPDYVATRLTVDDAPGRRLRTLLPSGRGVPLVVLVLGAMLLVLVASVGSGAADRFLGLVERSGDGAVPAAASVTPADQSSPPTLAAPPGDAPSTPTPSLTAAPSPSSPVSPSPVASASPSGSAVTYEVQPGDTLSTIATAHGTSVEALVAANDLANANVILPGQQLAIPQSGG